MSQMTVPEGAAGPGLRARAIVGLAAAMMIGAIGVAAYLTAAAFAGGVEPVGCGADSSCATVLGSRWSRVMGMPVSLPAVGVYVALLAGLVMVHRPTGRALVTLAAAAIIAAAGWFVFVQTAWLGAWCVYCMTAHGLGVLAAVLGLVVSASHGPWRERSTGLAVVLGVAAVAGLAVTQSLAGEPVHRIAVLDVEWTPSEEPTIGPADAERHLLVMVDFACPHCRHTHGVLLEARQQMTPAPSIVVLPVPLNPACNEHAPKYPSERFAESCDLARLALAVHLAEPAKFETFDRWLFEPEQPRSAEAAEAEAARLVGAAALEQALADPQIEQTLVRNTSAYGRSEAGRLPVTLMEGAEPVVGRIEQVETVVQLFEGGKGEE